MARLTCDISTQNPTFPTFPSTPTKSLTPRCRRDRRRPRQPLGHQSSQAPDRCLIDSRKQCRGQQCWRQQRGSQPRRQRRRGRRKQRPRQCRTQPAAGQPAGAACSCRGEGRQGSSRGRDWLRCRWAVEVRPGLAVWSVLRRRWHRRGHASCCRGRGGQGAGGSSLRGQHHQGHIRAAQPERRRSSTCRCGGWWRCAASQQQLHGWCRRGQLNGSQCCWCCCR